MQLQAGITEIENKVNSANNTISDAQAKIESAKAEVSKQEKTLASTKKKTETQLSNAKAELETSKQELQTAEAELTTQKEEFNTKIADAETELIDSLVENGEYIQLHKQNIYVNGKYCIEKADLMDENNVIMIKDQHAQADLVYLVKQATTSLRLASAREIGENVFKGRNICLWMLVKRKNLTKLSDFKSFHLLDALNDFKKSAIDLNLIPKIWVTLDGNK